MDILDIAEFLNGGLFNAGAVVPAVVAGTAVPSEADAAPTVVGPAPQDLAFAALASDAPAVSPRKKVFAVR